MQQRKLFGDIDGTLTPLSELTVHVSDPSVLRGYSVFEFFRTHHGTPFLLKEHLARLRHSARVVGLRVPVAEKELVRRIKRVIRKNAFPESFVYLILTGGESPDMFSYRKKPRLIIYSKKAAPLPPRLYTRGVRLITHSHTRNFPSAKTTDYLTRFALQPALARAKAFEVLYVSGNAVTECSTSNIFMFKGRQLITPRAGVLRGITRGFVLRVAKPAFEVKERSVTLQELLRADEVFITATNKKVLPVVKIDKKVIGRGVPGERTKELMERFGDATDKKSGIMAV